MSWSDLPADLVAAIADRIIHHADFACFRSVCPSWRSTSAVYAGRHRVPRLLLPTENHFHVDRRLWSPSGDRIVSIPVPAARGFFLFASPDGWTLAVDEYFSAALLHPFTGASAGLPGLPPSFRGDLIVRRDMVWDRSAHGVMIARRSTKAPCFFCRPGDVSWSPVERSEELDQVSSITYCDGAFYLFDAETRKTVGLDSETLAVCAVIETPAPALLMPDEIVRPWSFCKAESTLVVSSAELLLIVTTHLPCRRASDGGSVELFKAFRWDRRNPTTWEGVEDIGDRAVLVDSFRGFFVEANGVNGVRRNCVYVASSHRYTTRDGRWTVSVLDLAGLATEPLSLGNLSNCRPGRFWQRPSWFMPNVSPVMQVQLRS